MAYTTLKTLSLFPKVIDDIILSYIPHNDTKWTYNHYYSHAVILEYEYKHVPKKNRIFKYTKRGVDNAIREQIKYLLDKKANK